MLFIFNYVHWCPSQFQCQKMLIVARRVSLEEQEMLTCLEYMGFHGFYTPVSRRAVLCDLVWWAAGGLPHRFPHTNFSSVYRIFTKLGHLIPMWKGKNPFYLGVIRSKVKVTVTINDLVVKNSIYSNGDFDLRPNVKCIYMVYGR